MKPINIVNVIMANNSLNADLRNKLFKSWGISPKPDELTSLASLLQQFFCYDQYQSERVALNLGGCYLGFQIPQNSKEFDCLWIGDKTVINVELKSQAVAEEKNQRQLSRNRYYLSHLNREIKSFTYVASSEESYRLDENETLNRVGFQEIAEAVYSVHDEVLYENDIEKLFPPEKYLVSPFNSTDAFVEKRYFLTDHQQEIKTKILRFANNEDGGGFYAVYGGPGTGKTLLMYDIARTLMESGKKVIIGHAGSLNPGHSSLKYLGWDIRATKDMIDITVNSNQFEQVLRDLADVYFLDEAQRCYNLKQIAAEIVKHGKKCVVSLDPNQVMRYEESEYGNDSYVTTLVGSNCDKLTANIRTNRQVFDFTKALFSIHKTVDKDSTGFIEITYCQTQPQVRIIQEVLKKQGYEVPMFTPRSRGREEYQDWFSLMGNSAHAVIGQEFDKIAALISPNMHYNSAGDLVSGKPYYYNEEKMLYQILTRARNKIHLIIFNNPVVLERCLSLIN